MRPLRDPRIHGAVVCASISCRSLRREPCRAERPNAQLDDNVRRWLANPEKGLRIDRERERIHVSRIFKWFPENFERADGALGFAARYVPEVKRHWLEGSRGRVEIRWLDYDWTLNDLGGSDGAGSTAPAPHEPSPSHEPLCRPASGLPL